MPRTWTINDHPEELLKRKPVSLQAAIESNWNHHKDWEWTYNTNTFSPTAAQTRLFYPRSFTASSSLNALNSPWFIDYGHLTFWFFFLCTFLLVMWLVTLHNLTSKNIETRWPRRETRGFSRAQAGDVMTAVLPLTWSVTMLLHASTHSLNFDENTAATTFSFTVMAYQWGWNYYFPKDIVEKLANGPRLVGRNRIDLNNGGMVYNKLLEKARNEYLTRLTVRGGFADRFGRDTVPNLLNIFFRPGGNPSVNAHSTLVNGMYVAANSRLESKNVWRAGVDAKNKTKLSISNVLIDSNTISQLWLSTSLGSRRFAVNKKSHFWTTEFTLKTRRHLYAHAYMPVFQKNKKILPSVDARLSKTSKLNTARSAVSFTLTGNRLSLIHKHLTKSVELDKFHNRQFLYADFIRKRIKSTNAFGPLHSAMPSWVFVQPKYSPVQSRNITPNLWLLKNNASDTLSQLKQNVLSERNHRRIAFNPVLNKTTTNVSRFLNQNNTFKSNKFTQAFKYSGTPYTANFTSASLLSFEDMGLNNNSAVKQLQLRTNAHLIRSLNLASFQLSSKKSNTTTLRARNNRAFQFAGSVDSGLKSQHSKNNNHIKLLPTHKTALYSTTQLQTNLLNNGEIASAKKAWRAASKTFTPSLMGLTTKTTNAHYSPAGALILNRLSSNKSWAHAIAPYAMSGGVANHFSKSRLLLQKLTPVITPLKTPLNGVLKYVTSVQVKYYNKRHIYDLQELQTKHQIFLTSKQLPIIFYSHWINRYQLQSKAIKFNALSVVLSIKPRSKQVVDAKNITNKPKNLFLLSFKSIRDGKKVYSFWLEGVDSSKPTRSSLDRTNDVLNFAGKSDIIRGQKYIQHYPMFNWYWAWASTTQTSAFPTSKLFRGAIARRAVGGFWSTGWANDVLSQAALSPETVIDLNKQAFTTLVPSVRKITRTAIYPKLAFAVLDNEWSKLAHVPLCITPEPYEDLDQSFIHQKWAFEVNTTRRSDHTSKFKTTWGPFAISKLHKKTYTHKQQTQQLLSSIGPSVFSTLPVKALQQIALTNTFNLEHKNSHGLLPITPYTTTGYFMLHKNLGPFLYNNLTSTVAYSKNSLSSLNRMSSRHKYSALRTVITPGYWTTLWRFKLNLNDAQMLATPTNNSAFNTYWKVRALLTLSNRADLETNARKGGLRLAPKVTNRSVGDFTSLLQDIAQLNNRSQHKTSLDINAWKSKSWHHLDNTLASLLDRTVNAHLLARSGHSLANDEIGSLRRLRVTKGIYLPSDIPMHAVCASKDVIHSWALPGLNIKIDCIPGYNSHRRLMLRWRGAYWGQCMEVCGRYHHWMPILVNVVHKDIFLSWCLVYLKQIDARALSNSRALQTISSIDLLTLEHTLKKIVNNNNTKHAIKPTQFVAMVTYELDA